MHITFVDFLYVLNISLLLASRQVHIWAYIGTRRNLWDFHDFKDTDLIYAHKSSFHSI